MGSKASIQLQYEDIDKFKAETGCKYIMPLVGAKVSIIIIIIIYLPQWLRLRRAVK